MRQQLAIANFVTILNQLSKFLLYRFISPRYNRFMYDVLTIGTATRDVFLRSKLFRPVTDIHFLGSKNFSTGEAECFAFGGKIEVDAPVFTVGGGAVNSAVTFARQGLVTAAMCAVGKDDAGKVVINALKHESIKTCILF